MADLTPQEILENIKNTQSLMSYNLAVLADNVLYYLEQADTDNANTILNSIRSEGIAILITPAIHVERPTS